METQLSKCTRVLIKLSGEALGGGKPGIDPATAFSFAQEVKAAVETGSQIALVIGGGNIFRGIEADIRMDRVAADHMGMLATMINALALKQFLLASGQPAEALSALNVSGVFPTFSIHTARQLLSDNIVVIFAGGTNNPFFSTDTAAALRALEINANLLIKATKVDGVFDKDPKRNRDAVQFKHLSYDQVLNLNLKVMDAASIALCRDNRLPVRVINLIESGNLLRAVQGQDIGTLITEGDSHDQGR